MEIVSLLMLICYARDLATTQRCLKGNNCWKAYGNSQQSLQLLCGLAKALCIEKNVGHYQFVIFRGFVVW